MKALQTTAALLILALSAYEMQAQSWNINGNTGTNAATNFIGTTDAVNFKIRTNNTMRINITSSGKVAIGNFSPVFKLDVKGGSINTDSVYRIGGKTVISIAGNSNFFGGVNSGKFITIGGSNTACGYNSLYLNTSGNENAAFGESALYSNTTGGENAAFGAWALHLNTTGNYNSAFGMDALFNNSVGVNNTGIGVEALFSNTAGNNNTATGHRSLWNNYTGSNNTANGNLSLWNNYSGSNNTASGYKALYSNNTGFSNVAIGVSAMYWNTTGSNMVAIGDSALYKQGVVVSSVSMNTAIGSKSLFSNTYGFHNTANGATSLYSNISGGINAAFGVSSLYNNTYGNFNVACGGSSLYSNTTGGSNSAFGTSALYYNIDGDENSAFGSLSLRDNDHGAKNVACGRLALSENSSGNYNTASGYSALGINETGSKNTALGSFADVLSAALTNTTVIGANALVGKDNSMVLGDTSNILVGIGTAYPATRFHIKSNSNSTSPHILLEEGDNDYARLSFKNNTGATYWTIAGLNSAVNANERLNFYNSTTLDIMSITGDGKVGIGTTNPPQKLTVYNGTSTGTYTTTGWMHASDRRLKTNIKPLENSLDKILQLEGVSYNWKTNPADNNQIGFIAQEVERVFPEVIVKDAEGNYTMAPQNLTAPIIEAIKAQQQQITQRDEEIKELQNENRLLKSRLDNFENALSQCCMNYEQKTGGGNNVSVEPAKLEQNIPNPFSESTTIKFYIPENTSSGLIKVFSNEGLEIKSIPVSAKGFGQIEISGKTFSPGIYSYMLLLDGKVVDTKQMILTK